MAPIETVEKLSIPEDVMRNDSANSNNSISSASLDYSGMSSASTPSSRDSASPEESALFRMLREYSINIPNIFASSSSGSNYQRVAIPREQSLLDLLRHASNGEEIFTLSEVKLRVVAATISLSRIGLYCPRLSVLKLDGSILTSLRDIGTSLKHLKILHVSRCGLANLDGTFGLTSLQELYASDNNISHLGPCAALQNVKVINVERNCLTSLNTVSFLSICPKLIVLSLSGNQICKNKHYEESVVGMLPNLRMLDGKSLLKEKCENSEEEDNVKSDSESLSCSFDVSSLTEPNFDEQETFDNNFEFESREVISNSTAVLNSKVRMRRPTTSSGIGHRRPFSRTVSLPQRPKTATPTSEYRAPKNDSDKQVLDDEFETTPSILTSGAIVCGSIGRALAKSKMNKKGISCFGPSTSNAKERDDALWSFHGSGTPHEFLFCSLPAKIKSKKEIDARNPRFEAVSKLLKEPLPDKPTETAPVVELEFGVTGLASRESSTNSTPSPNEALKAAKMWRKAFKLYRKQNE